MKMRGRSKTASSSGVTDVGGNEKTNEGRENMECTQVSGAHQDTRGPPTRHVGNGSTRRRDVEECLSNEECDVDVRGLNSAKLPKFGRFVVVEQLESSLTVSSTSHCFSKTKLLSGNDEETQNKSSCQEVSISSSRFSQ